MGFIFLFPTLPHTDVSDMNYTVAVFGGTAFLSLVWYYFPKYGGVHWFRGPVNNVHPTGGWIPEGVGRQRERRI